MKNICKYMNKNGLDYKKPFKYDFMNLFESVNGPTKPKYISYRNNIIDFIKNEYQNSSRTHKTFNNRTSKKFKSFHKSLLHLKLSINPKYKDNENICYTDRRSKNRKEIENFKNTYEKIFLTNTDDKNIKTSKFNNYKQLKLITDYKTKKSKEDNKKENYISIPSNTFVSFRKNKHIYFIPDIINEKISDFIDDTKMIRNLRFINTIKVERKKRRNALLELRLEHIEILKDSLETSKKYINIYKKVFADYNKYLINEIKKEQKLLYDYNAYKKKLENEVNILQKKFDDIIKELEVVNNFKLIFTAIKNKTKIEDNNELSKKFIEDLLKKLHNEILIKRNNISYSPKKKTTINKSNLRKSCPRRSSIGSLIGNEQIINTSENEKMKEQKRMVKRMMTIITTRKRSRKKILRFNSYQPELEKNKKSERVLNKDNLDYDIDKNENIVVNNILKLVQKNDKINSQIVDLKVISENEESLPQNVINNKLLNIENIDLLQAKNQNKILTAKYRILHYNNKDYSLHLSIYRNINRIIGSIISFKIKNFNDIIDKLRKLYDRNKLYYLYKSKISENKSKNKYFEKELINYIYNALTIIEQLQCELINKKNDYLNNTYYQEMILEYESKMDTAKKIINNREKRFRELLRKQQIYNKSIEKSNKIIFRSFRKVPKNYPFNLKKKLNIDNNNNEDEELLLY